jgi:hypothetical protein
MNATEAPLRVHIEVLGLAGAVLSSAADVELPATQARWVAASVQLPPQQAQALGVGAHAMQFRFTSAGTQSVLTEKSTFVVPR